MHPKLLAAMITALVIITIASVGTVTFSVINQTTEVNSYIQQVDDLWELYGDMVKSYNEVYDDYTKAKADYDKLTEEMSASGWIKVEATAYSINDIEQGTTDVNALGWDLTDIRFCNIPQVAVDSNVIPLNSIVEIKGMGIYYAADTGGDIKGKRIDILMATKKGAKDFGRQDVFIRILDKGFTIR